VVPEEAVLPDDREEEDHEHDDEAHHRVVEHRVGVERLAPAFDVLLVALEAGAPVVKPAHSVGLTRRLAPRGRVWTRPARAVGGSGSRGSPAASSDQGGDETPSRTTR